MKHLRASCVGIALLLSSTAAIAQTSGEPTLQLNEKGYFEGPAVNVLVFSNWYDGLFADAKISGIEIIQQGMRSATNGDVRLSATPGQWDAIGALVERKVDAQTGVIETTLRYAAHDWQYVIRAERRGGAVELSIIQPGIAAVDLFPPCLYGGRAYRHLPDLSCKRHGADSGAQCGERAERRAGCRTLADGQWPPLRPGTGRPRAPDQREQRSADRAL